MFKRKTQLVFWMFFLLSTLIANGQQDAPPPVREEVPPAPPPPPPPPTRQEIIFKTVEEMPRFPACEDVNDKQEREQCAQSELLEYVYKNLNYPNIARKNKVEGIVIVSFIVRKDGSLREIKIVKDIGAGCGAEVVRVIQLMNDNGIRWIPGSTRGREFNVLLHLPVEFALDNPIDP